MIYIYEKVLKKLLFFKAFFFTSIILPYDILFVLIRQLGAKSPLNLTSLVPYCRPCDIIHYTTGVKHMHSNQ